jgi:hypothetical protein
MIHDTTTPQYSCHSSNCHIACSAMSYGDTAIDGIDDMCGGSGSDRDLDYTDTTTLVHAQETNDFL